MSGTKSKYVRFKSHVNECTVFLLGWELPEEEGHRGASGVRDIVCVDLGNGYTDAWTEPEVSTQPPGSRWQPRFLEL